MARDVGLRSKDQRCGHVAKEIYLCHDFPFFSSPSKRKYVYVYMCMCVCVWTFLRTLLTPSTSAEPIIAYYSVPQGVDICLLRIFTAPFNTHLTRVQEAVELRRETTIFGGGEQKLLPRQVGMRSLSLSLSPSPQKERRVEIYTYRWAGFLGSVKLRDRRAYTSSVQPLRQRVACPNFT